MPALNATLLRSALIAALSALPVAGLLLAPQISHAAAPQVKTQAPGYYRMMLGDFEITALSDGTVTLPLEKLLTDTTPARIRSLQARASLSSEVETSINAFLINTGSQLLLVDSGAGRLFGDKGGRLLANLQAAGYRAEDIDAVLLTHIHGDHSGGLTVDGKMVFPNATIYADKREAEFWLDSGNEAKAAQRHQHSFQEAAASLLPYASAGRLKTFSQDAELFSGVRSIAVPGHTPGHTFYAVESKGQQMQFWGDTVHAQYVQFPDPAVTIQFDIDSSAAAKQRKRVFADAAAKQYWVAAPHIAFPGIGHLRKEAAGFAWVPANYAIPR
ncbi:MBL fold metallo-hydrolase [Chitinimonas arctica]|uniref:MBL fold metallo-hydrolase n=1 Tax=Chitinimonas arctica TaxID=2594795 RepID=A0A516SFU1_9NEIS|nr:MBL fold metallo-hydrolase [Chitinimonas arctica]QDQ27023.1 MBL fold metallo-hydrolase [Chitinimonas arctica]